MNACCEKAISTVAAAAYNWHSAWKVKVQG